MPSKEYKIYTTKNGVRELRKTVYTARDADDERTRLKAIGYRVEIVVRNLCESI